MSSNSQELHHINFYKYDPVQINCMVYQQETKLLAVSRADNTIEIWNLNETPFHERTLISKGSVKGLAWLNNRLFSASQHGFVVEHDLFTGQPKSQHPVTSGECWCIAVHSGTLQLAAGSEEGYINIFDIHEDTIMFSKLFNRQEGGVTCLSWDSTGNYMASGSVDVVRVWTVKTGVTLHRMTTGRSVATVETVVRCIAVTNDFTVISGDSRGKLCFWDGHMGINIASYQSHKKEILALCLSEDHNTVQCAGVDPLIASYERVKMREGDQVGKWVKSIQRFIHDHDVNALTMCHGKLFSAGTDGYLAMSIYPPKTLVRYPPLLKSPCVYVARDVKCVLFRYANSLDLWLLGSKSNPFPSKLLTFTPIRGERVKSAALSDKASWMAVSTQAKCHLFSLNLEDPKSPQLIPFKINQLTSAESAAHLIAFSANERYLVIASISGQLFTVDLRKKTGPGLLYSCNPCQDKVLQDSINQLSVSPDGTFIAVSDLAHNVVIWSKGEVYAKLPKYHCSVTALGIHPLDFLLIAYSDHLIIEYDIKARKFTDFKDKFIDGAPNSWRHRTFAINSIKFDPGNLSAVIAHDDNSIMIINKSKEISTPEPKMSRRNHKSVARSEKYGFKLIKQFKHILHFEPINAEEVLAVEVTPSSLAQNLPAPSVKTSTFGKM